MTKNLKVYKVHIEYCNGDGDCTNYSSQTVLARDARGAIGRVKMDKEQYVVSAVMIQAIDVE